MLQQYAHSPEQNWKAKDCAIYLVMALTVRGKTAAQGATTTNQLVNVLDFFNQHVLPELQAQRLDERAVLKADALKYLTLFRSQIPKDTCMQVKHIGCNARLGSMSRCDHLMSVVSCRFSRGLWFCWALTPMLYTHMLPLQ